MGIKEVRTTARGSLCYQISPYHLKQFPRSYFASFFPEVYNRIKFHAPNMLPAFLFYCGVRYYASSYLRNEYEHHKF